MHIHVSSWFKYSVSSLVMKVLNERIVFYGFCLLDIYFRKSGGTGIDITSVLFLYSIYAD